MQQQHPYCQFEFEDYEIKTVGCDVCFTLDRRFCLGGSHKRHKDPLQGNIISFFALLVEIIVYNNAPSFTHFLESIFYFLHYPFHIQILLLHRKLINEREN